MSRTARLSIAYTPDSDDSFYYFALETGRVRVPGFLPEFRARPISDLNRAALNGVFDVTAISSVHYPAIAGQYAILSVGASVGRGYGPVLVSKEFEHVDQLSKKRVGVGGLTSTGCFLLRQFCPDATVVERPVAQLAQEVASGNLDAGVMIHEDLLNFPRLGLRRMADLGAAWCRRHELPLPVGLSVIRRDLGRSAMHDIASAIRQSLDYSMHYQDEAFAWLAKLGFVSTCTEQFVSMFANDDSLHLPADAREGLSMLLRQVAEESGAGVPPLDIVDIPLIALAATA
jgi:1,4-dihydroxy-6-naphthoate synthase